MGWILDSLLSFCGSRMVVLLGCLSTRPKLRAGPFTLLSILFCASMVIIEAMLNLAGMLGFKLGLRWPFFTYIAVGCTTFILVFFFDMLRWLDCSRTCCISFSTSSIMSEPFSYLVSDSYEPLSLLNGPPYGATSKLAYLYNVGYTKGTPDITPSGLSYFSEKVDRFYYKANGDKSPENDAYNSL